MLSYISSATGIKRGMEKMQRAFEIYPYCAMALNYLANHFFFTGQHFVVEQLTETALAVSNHGPTKSHSYYNLARSYHSKVGQTISSFFYYLIVLKAMPKYIHEHVCVCSRMFRCRENISIGQRFFTLFFRP